MLGMPVLSDPVFGSTPCRNGSATVLWSVWRILPLINALGAGDEEPLAVAHEALVLARVPPLGLHIVVRLGLADGFGLKRLHCLSDRRGQARNCRHELLTLAVGAKEAVPVRAATPALGGTDPQAHLDCLGVVFQ